MGVKSSRHKNQLRAKGHDPSQAAQIAARTRLRPILMTTLVLVAAMLPLSFKLVPGSEAMIPLARAMIGGMLVSTFLTLIVVPCIYSLVKRPGSPSSEDAPLETPVTA